MSYEARNLWDSLFTNCSCSDCEHSRYYPEDHQYYCYVDHQFRDEDDTAPCSYYEED